MDTWAVDWDGRNRGLRGLPGGFVEDLCRAATFEKVAWGTMTIGRRLAHWDTESEGYLVHIKKERVEEIIREAWRPVVEFAILQSFSIGDPEVWRTLRGWGPKLCFGLLVGVRP